MSDGCVTTLIIDDSCVVEIRELRAWPRRAGIVVVGDIDQSTDALLHTVLARVWKSQPVAVTIDLREATFLNAAGLRVLLLTSRTARLHGVPLVLRAAPGLVTRLLTMVGLGEQLLPSTEDTLDDAAAPAVPCPRLHLVKTLGVSGEATSPARDVATGSTSSAYRSTRALRATRVKPAWAVQARAASHA